MVLWKYFVLHQVCKHSKLIREAFNSMKQEGVTTVSSAFQ